MIDYGLLLSVLVALSVPALVVRWWPFITYEEPVGFVDVAIWPAAIGVIVGRLVTLAIDDPASMFTLSDFVIVRSGVEFWPAVVAAASSASWTAWRSGVAPLARLADLAPHATLGYAAYEAACFFRDGCFGPVSRIGLRPPGVSSAMVPVGLLVAALLVGLAVVLRLLVQGGRSSAVVVTLGLVGVSSVRSLASFWLPHVGTGPTRQHETSMVVFVLSAIVLLGAVVRDRSRRSGIGLTASTQHCHRG